MKRIGLITTLDTNIGDDFIRLGIVRLLGDLFRGEGLELVPVNKHRPSTVYPSWHPMHLRRFANAGPLKRAKVGARFDWAAARMGHSRFDGCDLIVQCGAPVVWPSCHECEWALPLWHRVVAPLASRIPVLNIAAGSCFPWERRPTAIEDPRDAAFLRRILGYCRVTTARDTLARDLFASLGADTPFIPCTAFLAPPREPLPASGRELILVNYMERGGHYDWGQEIDAERWRDTMLLLIRRLSARHRLAFLCHNEKEALLASRLDSGIPRILPRDADAYFKAVSLAKGAVCNRLHASVALAGLGIPSVSVGTDTRLLMVDALGLPNHFVKEATADLIEGELEALIARGPAEEERLLALRRETSDAYLGLLREKLPA